MKINIRKITASVMALTMMLSSANALQSYGASTIDKSMMLSKSSRLSMPSDARVSLSVPSFRSVVGQDLDSFDDLVPMAAYEAITESVSLKGDASALPSAYDMREEGEINSVKNQGSYGTCWTFASAASAETSLLEYIPSIDLSEWHTAFYPYYGDDQMDLELSVSDTLQYGGTCFTVANLWSQWRGPIAEEKLPYGDEAPFTDDMLTEKYSDMADYHLKNAYMFDYNEEGSNRKEVNELIKQFLYSGSAVDVSFSTDGYYSITNSCYSKTSPLLADHSVTICGWDDSFPATNFRSSNRPSGNGAWLVRNSWDTGWGEGGYFWISYEDTSLSEFAVFELDSKDNYSENYYHDTFIPTALMAADENEEINQPSYMANVFTASENQQIEAVSTYINNPGTEYEVTIYTDLENPSDPDSGTASAVTYGSSDVTGYITIELDEDVIVNEGELFAVSVKLYCEDNKYVLPHEACMVILNEETGDYTLLTEYTSYEKICEYTGENESFYSADGAEWTDMTSKNQKYTEEEKSELLESIIAANADYMTEEQIAAYREIFAAGDLVMVFGNMSVKAFANPVDTVDFSHISGNVPLDEKVALSVKNGSPVYYSVNGGAEILYTEPIAVTEDMKISATTDHHSYTVREYTPAKAEFMDIGYFTSYAYSDGNDIMFAERISESEYVINLSGAESSLKLFAVTAADVLMNGAQMSKNEFTSAMSIGYGETVVVFTLSQENRLDNTVTLTINRSPVSIDIESETVSLNKAEQLTAPDGHVFVNGESVSEYAGQTLTAIANGETIEVKVPERAQLPELEIDYYNETLNFIPNETAELTEYAIGKAPSDEEFISAEERFIDGQNITSGKIMNKAFRIIPGETVTLRVAPGNGMFGSYAVTYEIPSAGAAPSEEPEYTVEGDTVNLEYSDILEFGAYGKSLTAAELDELAKSFGYSTEEYTALQLERYGVSDTAELLKLLSVDWDAIFEFTAENGSVEIPVRYYSGMDTFASQVKYTVIPAESSGFLKGDANKDGKITTVDAALVLSYYADTATGEDTSLSDETFELYDYNSDGKITTVDAAQILGVYAENATK